VKRFGGVSSRLRRRTQSTRPRTADFRVSFHNLFNHPLVAQGYALEWARDDAMNLDKLECRDVEPGLAAELSPRTFCTFLREFSSFRQEAADG
jgi:hypothetical protein